MKSIFSDKNKTPATNDLIKSLGDTYQFWQVIFDYVILKYPKGVEEWNYSGDKFGWSFRVKDKKRILIYMLPRDKFFKVAFVIGQKAVDLILKSPISNEIKLELQSAKVYAEGRGIRIDIKSVLIMQDIKRLIDFKLSN